MSSTITSLIGGGGVVVTLTFSVNIYRAPHNTPSSLSIGWIQCSGY